VSTDAPPGLKGSGLDIWTRLAATLVSAGILTQGDMALFERYCLILTQLKRAETLLARTGLEMAIAKGYVSQVLKLTATFRQLAAELGLTPSSRGGVKAAKRKEPGKLEQFLRAVK
jgi:P27 family predicted phage terminase small subunit